MTWPTTVLTLKFAEVRALQQDITFEYKKINKKPYMFSGLRQGENTINSIFQNIPIFAMSTFIIRLHQCQFSKICLSQNSLVLSLESPPSWFIGY